MSQNKASLFAGMAFALFAAAWLVHSPFHPGASDVLPRPSARTRFVRLAPERVADSIARRDQNHSILPVSRANALPLRDMLARQAAILEKSAQDFDIQALEAEWDQYARNLSREDIAELGRLMRDEGESENKRGLAVFLLGRAGTDGIGELTKLAMNRPPGAAGADSLELRLRISALRALDAQARTASAPVKSSLKQIIANQTHPTLQMMAKIALDRATDQVLSYGN